MPQLFVKILGTLAQLTLSLGDFGVYIARNTFQPPCTDILHQTVRGSVQLVNHFRNEPVPDTYIIRTLRRLPCAASEKGTCVGITM